MDNSVSMLKNPKPEQQPQLTSGVTNKRIFNVIKPFKQSFNITSVPCSTANRVNGSTIKLKESNKAITDTPIVSSVKESNKELQIIRPQNNLNKHETFENYKKYCKAYCINIILANQVLS